MRRLKSFIGKNRIVALFIFIGLSVHASEWEEFGRWNDITLFRKEVSGSVLLAYKGQGEVNASIGKLLTVILDTPRKPEWMSRIREARVLKLLSAAPDEYSALEYIHVKTPWPITDRDFVYTVKATIDRSQRTITVHYESVEDPSKPIQPHRVRAQVYSGTFVLSPSKVNPAQRTHIEAETHADPKGSLPKWIVNIYQKRLPTESLEGLLRQASKPGIPDHPLARDLLSAPAAQSTGRLDTGIPGSRR